MKTRLFFTLMLAASLYSCTRSRYATTGAYESDDAYYTSSDTYIADFALVDDEAQMVNSSDSSATSSSTDDYYDPSYPGYNAYSSSTYSDSWSTNSWNSSFNSCNNGWGSGFGNYHYGNHWNCSPFMMPSVGWNPYSGYYSNFTFTYGYNPYWNPYSYSPYGYNPYNSWYTPYYSQGYYNGWAYNPWYFPYNYYNQGIIDNTSGGGILHGPRNTISAISAINSSYSNGLFYNGTKRKIQANTPQIEPTQKPSQQPTITIDRPDTAKPRNTNEVAPSSKPVREKPTYTPSKPIKDRNIAKPGLTKPREVAPRRDRNLPAPSRGSGTAPSRQQNGRGNAAPANSQPRDNKPSVKPEPSSKPRNESPTRETPRTSPRTESSPSRTSPAPSKSSSGGGSTNSPRRK